MAEPQQNPEPSTPDDETTAGATVTPLPSARPPRARPSSTHQDVVRQPLPGHGVQEPGKNQILDTDRPAGIISRGIAALLDVGVVLAIMGGIYLAFVIGRLIYNVQSFSLPETNPFFTATAFVGVSLLYLSSCWAVSGRTIGAVVMGLRLVSRKGKPRVRPSVAFVRACICVFFSVGLIWVVVDRRRRSVADLIVRTRVMYSR